MQIAEPEPTPILSVHPEEDTEPGTAEGGGFLEGFGAREGNFLRKIKNTAVNLKIQQCTPAKGCGVS